MEKIYSLSNFYYELPQELIAQRPLEERDKARLLVVDRKKNTFKEYIFKDIINFLEEEDVLVINDTKVIKARLWAKRETGAKIEILLTRKIEDAVWKVLARPARRLRLKEVIFFNHDKKIYAQILERTPSGEFILKFSLPVENFLNKIGNTPLPPYIKEKVDEKDYQTVFSQKEGSIASPTAGLHFTHSLLEKIKDKGVKIAKITLHCGAFTFRPVKTEDIRKHKIQEEYFIISQESAQLINEAKKKGKRIFAVGTTTTRALESSISEEKIVIPQKRYTSLYIYPGYKFKIVDALITNFHTPCSTNLILVASFCGLELVKKAYQYTIERKFRFFSLGDAMLIL